MNLEYKNVAKISIPIMFNILFTVGLSLKAISPYYSRNFDSSYYFMIFVGWLFTALWSRHFKIENPIRNTVFVGSFALLLWQVLIRVIGVSSINWNNYIFRIVLYSLPLVSLFIINNYSIKAKKLLLGLIICVCAFNILDNYFLTITNPSAYVGLYLENYVSNRLTNAGGTEFNAMCMFLAPSLIILSISASNRIIKLLLNLLCVIDVFAIFFVCPHATALILSVIMIGLCIYVTAFGKNSRMLTVGLIIGLVFTMILFLNIQELLDWFISINSSSNIQGKLTTIKSILAGTKISDTQGSFSERTEMAMVSLNTFTQDFSSFLFGIGEHGVGQTLADFRAAGVGGHSEFLDYLAKYGCIGTMFLVNTLRIWFRYLTRISTQTEEKANLISIIVCVFFVIYSFMNKSFKLELFYPLFVIFPVSLSVLNDSEIEI